MQHISVDLRYDLRAMQPTFDLLSSYDQLSTTERHFVDEYVDDLRERALSLNEPLIKALDMPVTPSMVEHSRGFLARRLVLAAIAERIKVIAADTDLSWRRVAEGLMVLGFSNMADYVELDPTTNQPRPRLDVHDRRKMGAVKKLKFKTTVPANPHAPTVHELELELYDRYPALRALTEHMAANLPGNPYWREHEAKHVTKKNVRQIDAHADAEKAAEQYTRRLRLQREDE